MNYQTSSDILVKKIIHLVPMSPLERLDNLYAGKPPIIMNEDFRLEHEKENQL